MESTLLVWMVCIVCLIQQVVGQSKKELQCAACKVIVDEIEYAVKQIDPKKRLEIESFRVDPRGNQKTKSVPYARSETHLTEVLESVCNEMKNYARSIDKESGEISFKRTDSRDGKPVTLENVSMSGQTSEQLKFACESIVEDHEEDMVSFFKVEEENPTDKFCRDATNLCKAKEDEDDGEEDASEGHSEL